MGAGALFGYTVRFHYGKLKFLDVPLAQSSPGSAAALSSDDDDEWEEGLSGDEQRPGRPLSVSGVYPWLLKGGRIARSEIGSLLDLYILGTGTMGTVRLAQWPCMHRKLLVAVKSVRKDFIRRYHDEEHIKNERAALMVLRKSPFIVRLFNTFQDNEAVHFLLEYVAGGGLRRRLARRGQFSSEEAKFYGAEAFLAVEHIHACGMVYRDLCPDNIMLDESGHCKLVDFGTARRLDEDGRCASYVGGPFYMSPERLVRGTRYGAYVDWWSLGCLLHEMVTGSTPFSRLASDTPNDIHSRILRGSIIFPESVPQSLVGIISRLLTATLQDRLVNPADIRADPFFSFTGFSWSDFEVRKIVPPYVPRVRPGGDPFYSDGNMGDLHPRPKYVYGAAVKDPFDGFG